MSIPRRVRIAPRLKTVLVTAIPQQMAKAPKIAIPGILFKRQKKTISATAGQGTIPVTKASQRSSFHVALFAMKFLFLLSRTVSRMAIAIKTIPVKMMRT